MFPDLQIVKQYQCGKIKTVCLPNRTLTPSVHVDLESKMKTNPYNLDGGNNSDLTKLNPLTVNIFDIFLNKVTSNFLDM